MSDILSWLSLVLASIALGWNIYRDIIIKPRCKVTLDVVRVVSPGVMEDEPLHKVCMMITNFGPGKANVRCIAGGEVGMLRRWFGKARNFLVNHPHNDPLSTNLPAIIDVGEEIQIVFPYTDHSFLKADVAELYAIDTFGRKHRVNKKQIQKACARWKQDFSA